jgi:DNA-binding MarR family transcriptional regulator
MSIAETETPSPRIRIFKRPLSRSVSDLLHRAHQAATYAFFREMGSSGLTQRQYAVLLAVQHNCEMSQTDLTEITGMDRSTLAEVVSRLVDRRLLKRTRKRQDRRTYAVTITAAGEKLLQDFQASMAKVDQQILASVEPDTREAFLEILGDIAEGEVS